MVSAITHRSYCVSPTKKRERSLTDLSFLTSKETMRSLSDVPIHPTKKGRTNISQEPQESSFLVSKETDISISDVPISPGKKNLVSISLELRMTTTKDPFLPSNETEITLSRLSTSPAKKSHTSMSQKPEEPSPMNTGEASKSHCFWPNPNYLKINNITVTASDMNTGNLKNSGGMLRDDLSSRYQSYISLGSQRFSGQFLMIPNPGFVDLSSTNLNVQSVFTTSIEEMKIISKEQKEKEEQHWTIKKELTQSDVNYLTCRRLTLGRRSVEEHILKHLPPEDAQKIDRGKPGLKVKVYDNDTDTTQELLLAFQRSYVLKDGWYTNFIKRRGLREREEIGLFWDLSDSKLHFSVLSRKSSCR
ncbi:putative B3 domain-containing protein [Cardamine amara subsp. amara]|uniref:B3 domain-containing protein n=1 Tax=Cardamine amara subsp. amara TaxID=228776 RepID=A0ABD1B3R0_CARAN